MITIRFNESEKAVFNVYTENGRVFYANDQHPGNKPSSRFVSNHADYLKLTGEVDGEKYFVELVNGAELINGKPFKPATAKVGQRAPKMSPLASALLIALNNDFRAVVEVAGELGMSKEEYTEAMNKAGEAYGATERLKREAEDAVAAWKAAEQAKREAESKYRELVFGALNNAGDEQLMAAIVKASAAKVGEQAPNKLAKKQPKKQASKKAKK